MYSIGTIIFLIWLLHVKLSGFNSCLYSGKSHDAADLFGRFVLLNIPLQATVFIGVIMIWFSFCRHYLLLLVLNTGFVSYHSSVLTSLVYIILNDFIYFRVIPRGGTYTVFYLLGCRKGTLQCWQHCRVFLHSR